MPVNCCTNFFILATSNEFLVDVWRIKSQVEKAFFGQIMRIIVLYIYMCVCVCFVCVCVCACAFERVFMCLCREFAFLCVSVYINDLKQDKQELRRQNYQVTT